MNSHQVYKNPQINQPLLSTISSGCRTPLLDVKFCNLIKGFYYPNSPTIPRYSVTCIVDPEKHSEFLNGIQTIEKNENVASILKKETIKENGEQGFTGKIIMKFQSKDHIPVFVVSKGKEPSPLELEDELAKDEKVMVVYDILRYTKKNTMNIEHGLSFKPTEIYYYPQGE